MTSARNCSVTGCAENWSFLVTEVRNRRVLSEHGYCSAHGKLAITTLLTQTRLIEAFQGAISADEVFCDIILSVFDYAANHHWVYLQEQEEGRILAVNIGYYEATTLYNALYHRSLPRPMTHEVMVSLVSNLGGEIQNIIIDRFDDREKYYAASVRIRQGNRTISIDCRPSDAFTFGVHANAPFLLTRTARDQLPRREAPNP